MSTQPSIFVSYAHKKMDQVALEAFEMCLQEASKDRIDIVIDRTLSVGAELSKFISQLNTCDAVIILFTPQYYNQIKIREGIAYEEYKIIKARFENQAENPSSISNIYSDSSFILPILFSGELESSIPLEMRDIVFADMVSFYGNTSPDGKVHITRQVQQKFEDVFNRIVDLTLAKLTLKLKDYRSNYQHMLDTLFVETKAEKLREKLTGQQWKQILVSTRAFEYTSTQRSMILVGRKGSGKSTIVRHLYDECPYKYKTRIHIDLEKFKFESLFGIFYNPKTKSEIKTTYGGVVGFFRCLWTLFIFLCCGLTLLLEEKKGNLSRKQIEVGVFALTYFNSISNYIRKNVQIDFFILFMYSFELITNDIDKMLSEIPEKEQTPFTEVVSKFEDFQVLERLVVIQAISSFLNVVKHSEKKFLLSLDGFDTKFNEFRCQTINGFMPVTDNLNAEPLNEENKKGAQELRMIANERIQFEIDWLRGLFHTILRLKSEFFEEGLFEKIDFCITIPKDRYIEARKADRDGFIYDNRMAYLDWSARELFIMIRKRLDLINNFYHKDGDAVERLWIVLKEYYPNLPRRLKFSHGHKEYDISLENYILRHTFWRPRDMLKYFAGILAYYATSLRHKRAISVDGIRECISNLTTEIVETEFLGEFSSICFNLEEIIKRFYKKPLVLSYIRFYEILESADFIHAEDTYRPRVFRDKLEFLYKIGFIGIKLSKNIKEEWPKLPSEIFYFSDGDGPLKSFGDDELESIEYIVHPVFCEKLRLNTKDHDLVLVYSDAYLDRNDTF